MTKNYSPGQLLLIARRNVWIILWSLIAGTVAGALYASTLPDTYRAEATIRVIPQRVPQSYVRPPVDTSSRDRVEAMGREILSRTSLERAAVELNLFPPNTRLTEELVDGVRSRINVAAISDDAFQITFTSNKPEEAKKGVDFLTTLYIERNNQERQGFTDGTRSFLSAELDNTRRQLIAQEQRLQSYRLRYGTELPSQENANLQRLALAEQRLQTAREGLERARERLESLGSAPVTTTAATSLEPPPGTAAHELQQARAEYKEMLQYRTPEHPDVVSLARRLKTLETRARLEETSAPRPSAPPTTVPTPAEVRAAAAEQVASYEAEINAVNAEIGEYRRRIAASPQHETGLSELSRDYETTQDLYHKLLGQLQESQLAANLEQRQVSERFRIIDAARLPEEPIGPKRERLILFGLMLGLALAGGIAFIRDQRDSTLHDPTELTAALNLPVFAMVPSLATPRERRLRHAVTALLSIVTLAGAVASTLFAALTLQLITRADVHQLLWF